MGDLLLSPALFAGWQHEARIGARRLEIADLKPGKLRDPGAGYAGDLDQQPEFSADLIGAGDDGADCFLIENNVPAFDGIRDARKRVFPSASVADALIVCGGMIERRLEDRVAAVDCSGREIGFAQGSAPGT